MSNQEILERARGYVRDEQDETFRREVEELIDGESWDELEDRFYTHLSFGTGGLRGIIGGGTNRINPYNVRRTTQGLADYIKTTRSPEDASVVIAYDSRNYSDLFALEAAKVLCGNGIKAYLFTSLRPTPELSFGVRQLGATAGIVITASHNPPAYNGYKVYWEDGGQIIAPHDRGIIEQVEQVRDVDVLTEKEARSRKLLVDADAEVDGPYLEMIKRQALRPDMIRERGGDLTVVFTPLHGTGGVFVPRALEDMGIGVTVVPDQAEPNGDFPTVESPNPEESSALRMALDLAAETNADLVMGTDPDSDRLGVAVRDGDDYRLLSGNQLGVLLADYIFTTRSEAGTLPSRPAFVKTIVTTDLVRLVAQEHGAACFDTLTGFKYIAAKIREFEDERGGHEFVFGCEESYGYLVGTEVRDKDAVSAATMTAEMALYHLSRGGSILRRLEQLYRKHGTFQEILLSRSFTGAEGVEARTRLMERLRNDPPAAWGGIGTERIKDYREGTTRDLAAGKEDAVTHDIRLPRSNVLQFLLEDGSVITARPSGTEPKIKFYASCRSEPGRDPNEARDEVGVKLKKIAEQIDFLL